MDPRRRNARADVSVGWPDLPPELLEGIMKLLSPLDRVTVRLVCSSWRTCARASFPSDLPFEAPRLLLRRPGGGLSFFSLRRGEILPFALPARLSAARCCGHMGGWLAMAFDDDREIALCSVTSGESVAIPRPPVFPVAKMVLSAPPTTRGWVVAVLGRSGTIALLQPDAEGGGWMTMEEGAKHGGFEDMAIWRGRLCALGGDGAVVAYRVSLGARVAAAWVLRAAQHPVGYAAGQQRVRGRVCMYLVVDMSGELVVVHREYSVRRDAVEVELILPHAIGVYSLADGEVEGLPISGGHSVAAEPVGWWMGNPRKDAEDDGGDDDSNKERKGENARRSGRISGGGGGGD
uniref:F-box domain-containing protein n=1 Tax=Oryza punctata TaxID=4537 RepID=A0A0E0KLQ5_ORYPU